MNPHNHEDEPADLLRELETLQRVLDDAAGDQVVQGLQVPVFDPLDDIPVLDELFTGDDIPVLKPVRPQALQAVEAATEAPAPVMPLNSPTAPVASTVSSITASRVSLTETDSQPVAATSDKAISDKVTPAPVAEAPARPRVSSNPFLPQSVLDRLSQEREAARHSAEEAHRTMQKVTEQKQARARQTLNDIGRQLSQAEKETLISQMVDDMLPVIAERLREKLRQNLN